MPVANLIENATAPAVSTPPKQRRGRPWLPGQSGNPKGRPPGSRNKLGEHFLSALEKDFREHGAETLRRMREEDPSGYIKVIAQLVPKHLHATVDTGPSWLEALRLLDQRKKANGLGAIDVTLR